MKEFERKQKKTGAPSPFRRLRLALSFLVMLALLFSMLPISTALASTTHPGPGSSGLLEEDPGQVPREEEPAEAPPAGEEETAPADDPEPCPWPQYCTDPDCDCAGGEPCSCDDSCACYTASPSACTSPGQCTTAGCLCRAAEGPHKPELCICGDDCLCRIPAFNLQVDTRVESGSSLELETGKLGRITVSYYLNSSELTFSDVYIHTYVAAPLEPVEVDIEGQAALYKQLAPGEAGNPSDDHHLIITKCSASGSAAGVYSFNVRFPAGITPAGITPGEVPEGGGGPMSVYSTMEAKVHSADGQQEWQAGPQHNTIDPDLYSCAITSKAESSWSISMKNVDLDYKDPTDGDNIFRVAVTLTRDPADKTEGVYHLLPDSQLLVDLFRDKYSAAAGLEILRVTTGVENAETESSPISLGDLTINGNLITIPAEKISWDHGFGGTPRSSAATAGTVYVVYKVDEDYLAQLNPQTVGEFTEYDAENYAAWTYDFVNDQGDTVDHVAPFEGVTYSPGSGKGGSIGKYADPYIEGLGFFADYSNAGADPAHTPIQYRLYYTNNSNTPVTGLTITDPRPEVRGRGNTLLTGESALAQAAFFTRVGIASWNAGPTTVEDMAAFECTLYYYLDSQPDVRHTAGTLSQGDYINLAGAPGVTDPKDIAKLELGVAGVLRHGFSLRLDIQASGNHALDDVSQQELRNKVYYVRNQAQFTAVSTKDTSKTLTAKSHDRYVHVYPYANTSPQLPVWTLSGGVGASAGAAPASTVEVARGKDVYITLRVKPKPRDEALDYLYNPVFFVELPPELKFEGKAGDISYLETLASSDDNPMDFKAETITNPVGAGQMLRIQPEGKLLMNPAKNGVIRVRCKVYEETPYGINFNAKVYFGTTDPQVKLDADDELIQQSDKITNVTGFFKDGETADILLRDTVNIQVKGSGFLEGSLWVQTEFDRKTNGWHRHPEIADSLPGGLLNYKFEVVNGGSYKAKEIVLYCVFSCKEDKYLINQSERKSEWDPYLVARVQPPVSGATVRYSEYANHKVSTGGKYTGANDWTEDPYNLASVKAIQITLPADYELAAGEKFEMTVPMYAPVDYVCKETETGDLAICSLATQFRFDSSNSFTQALEPLKVAVHLTPNQKGEISGLIWGEKPTPNGLKDSGEYPEGDVEVSLYKDGLYLYTVPTDTEGKYKFTNLEDGSYVVRAALPGGYQPGGAGAHNKFTATDGTTYIETAPMVVDAITQDDADRVFTEVDGAIYATPGSISGEVWWNMDGTGERSSQNDGSLDRDTGIPGAQVRLVRIINGGKTEPAGTTTTDADGKYSFTGVIPGRYYLVFDKPATATNYSYVPRAEDLPAGPWVTRADEGSPFAGSPGLSQAAPKADAEAHLAAGQSLDIWLRAGAVQQGVDCGFKPALGAIAGTLWHDLDGSGDKNGSEAGINGRTVTLLKTSGYQANNAASTQTATTKDGGKFSFANLEPGTYSLRYACQNTTDTKEYVSNLDGTTSATAIAEGSRAQQEDITGIVVSPGGTLSYTGRDFGVVSKLKISGRVYNDKNATGTWQATPDENQAGVTVTVSRRDPQNTATELGSFTKTTDADGYTTGLELWPGTYVISFSGLDSSLNGYLVTNSGTGFNASTRTWTLSCSSGGSKANVDLALTRPRSIAGMVWLDEDGSAAKNGSEAFLAGRGITLARDTNNKFPLPAGYTTGQQSATGTGAWLFEGLYPGKYTLTVDLADSPENYLITNPGADADNHSLAETGVYTVIIPDLDSGSDLANKNFGLAKPVTLTGKVWRDNDLNLSTYLSNGSFEASDTPLQLAGVATLLRSTDGGSTYSAYKSKTAGSGADGTYSFAGLPPGNYRITLGPGAAKYYITGPAATTAGTASYSFVDATSVATWTGIVVASGGSQSGLDLSLGEYSTITGKLWHDEDGDGVMDSGEAVLTSTEQVQLYTSPKGESDSAKDSLSVTNGIYSFKVKPGAWLVQAQKGGRRVTNPTAEGFSGGGDATADPNWTVTVASTTGSTIANKDFLFSLYSKILGNVWIDKNGSGAMDSGEAAKTGVQLTLACAAPVSAEWWAAYTPRTLAPNAAGAYEFANLWPGTYTVTLEAAETGALTDYLRTNIGSAKVTQVGQNQWQWQVVVESTSQNRADYGMVKPSTLSVDFFHDANNNQAKGTGEGSIGTATLTRTGVSGSMAAYTATQALAADGSGHSFTGLLPGSYSLTLTEVEAGWLRTCFTSGSLSLSSGSGAATMAAGSTERSYTITIADTDGSGIAATGAVAGYAAPGTIGGQVFHDINQNQAVGTGEDPISGVTATLSKRVGGSYVGSFTPAHSTAVNEDGVFSFGNLLPGSYQVTFSGINDAAWLTTTANGKTQDTGTAKAASFARSPRCWTIELTSDGQAVVVDTGLVKPATLAGAVWKDADANGSFNSESWYSGLTVNLYAGTGTSGTPVDSATTATTTGAFSFTGLYPGSYTLQLVRPDTSWYPTNTAGTTIFEKLWTLPVTLAEEDALTGLNFGVTQLVTAQGLVWQDKNTTGPNGEYDADVDTLLEDAQISIAGTAGAGAGSSGTATTGAAGSYKFENLLPGSYTITLTQPDNMVVVTEEDSLSAATGTASLNKDDRQWTMTASSGHQQEDLDFALAEKAVLSISVWHDQNADGSRHQSDDADLEGVALAVYKHNGTGYNQLVSPSGFATSSNGKANLNLSITGSYRVILTLPSSEWGLTTGAASFDIEVDALNELYDDASFGLSKYVTLSGRVWEDPQADGVYTPAPDGADSPLAGHTVEIWRNGSKAVELTTAADGGYTTTLANKLFAGSFTAVVAPKTGQVACTLRDGFDRATLTWDAGSLLSGQSSTGLDCAFAKGLSISGTLWEDVNATSSLVAADGDCGIEGATLKLVRSAASGGEVVETTQTGPGGHYSFANLMRGSYTVEVTNLDQLSLANCPPANGKALQPVYTGCYKDCLHCPHEESDFDLRTGTWALTLASDDILDVRSGVHVASEINGVLKNATTKKPVPGQEVKLFRQDREGVYEEWAETLTQTDGGYHFAPLIAGSYEVRVAIPKGSSIGKGSDGDQEGNYIVVGSLEIAGMGQELESTVLVVIPTGSSKNKGGGSGADAASLAELLGFTAPQTGDATGLLSMGLLGLGSLGALAAGIRLGRGRRRPKKQGGSQKQIYKKPKDE